MAQKKLTRSANKIFGGVCGGLAEYFGIDATLVRICYAALTIFSAAFPGIILYIIMLLLIPYKDPSDRFDDAEVVE